jgi:L-threonylcarbamoyladenylate synthase
VAQALLKACRTGVAGPSANRFGRVSPTTAAHVADEMGDALFVLDGGPCEVGIESTIVDCTRGQPVLLRPGVLTRAQLEAACGEPVLDNQTLTSNAPRASGTLASHYAPNAKVRLMNKTELQAALAGVEPPQRIAVYAYSIPDMDAINAASVLYRAMPLQASQVAHELFAVLREFDAQGVAQIWVEALPAATEWDGVRDRLTRAAVQP